MGPAKKFRTSPTENHSLTLATTDAGQARRKSHESTACH
jgi:hypothetical protein